MKSWITKKWKPSLLLLGISAFTTFLIIALSTFEAANVERNSIKFFFGAPDYIHSINLIEECRSPKYQWKGRDGEGSGFSSIDYGSTASTDAIFNFHKKEFEKKICHTEAITTTPTSKVLLRLICRNPAFASANVFIAKEGTCKNITIDIIEND